MIGNLSKRHESNGKPGAIGFDAVGGWSYGLYQIATRTGTMSLFLAWLANSRYKWAYERLKRAGGDIAARDGGAAFKSAWTDLADDPEFTNAQHEYIKVSHYDVQAGRINAHGLNIDTRSGALRDVVWSTAVQHGAKTNVITGVIAEHGALPDAQLIPLIYAERRTRFGSSTPKVRAAVMRRFDDECAEALAMLRDTRTNSAPAETTPEPTKPALKPANSATVLSQKPKINDRSKYL
jgi:hypothetical protein